MIRLLSIKEILELHQLVLAQSGGSPGLRDAGALASAVAQPNAGFGGTELHSELSDKAAALGYSLIRSHPFIDGNKRVGHAALETTLLLNGHELSAEIDEQEQVVLNVAAGSMPRAAFAAWVASRLAKHPA